MSNTDNTEFLKFWESAKDLTPADLYQMCKDSTAAVKALRSHYLDLIDGLIIHHDLDVTEDPDTEFITSAIFDDISTLTRQHWNLDYDEQEEEEQAYLNAELPLLVEERPAAATTL